MSIHVISPTKNPNMDESPHTSLQKEKKATGKVDILINPSKCFTGIRLHPQHVAGGSFYYVVWWHPRSDLSFDPVSDDEEWLRQQWTSGHICADW